MGGAGAREPSDSVADDAALARQDAPKDAPAPPAESDRCSRAETMKLLGVSTTQLHARVAAGELRSWRVGRDVVFERSEVEALAGKSPETAWAALLREGTRLLQQSHAHNEKALQLLLDGVKEFGGLAAGVVEKVLERNKDLETQMAAARDSLARNVEVETTQGIAMMRAEAELERERALIRAGERIVPVVMARLSKGSPAEDAAVAGAVRALASDPDMVKRLRAGLTPEQLLPFDSLVQTLQAPERGAVDGKAVVDAKSEPGTAPPANGGTTSRGS